LVHELLLLRATPNAADQEGETALMEAPVSGVPLNRTLSAVKMVLSTWFNFKKTKGFEGFHGILSRFYWRYRDMIWISLGYN
jgi:hypothetical protein